MINEHDLEDPARLRDLSWRSRDYARLRDKKIVIFVEDQADCDFYQSLIGVGLARSIEFARPPKAREEGGNGGHWASLMAVRDQEGTDEEWLSEGVKKHYCLLDGEEAMVCGFDGYDESDGMVLRSWLSDLNIPNIVAPPPRGDVLTADLQSLAHRRSKTRPRNDGVILLNCHELENLYLLYADAVDMMNLKWGARREIYGSKLPAQDSWKVLHRCILISAFNNVRNKFNIESKDYSDLFKILKSHEKPLKNLPGLMSEALIESVHRDLRDAASSLLATRLNWLQTHHDDVRNFSHFARRICDGKYFLSHAGLNADGDKHRFRKMLLSNGFARDFQLSLMFTIMRGAARGLNGKEAVFGRGPFALTAWSRSGFHP